MPTSFPILTRDPQGEPRLGLFHAANPELLAAGQELQRKGTYPVADASRRVMRTGRSELHPKVTPEWLLAQGTNDELTPHDSEVWHPLAHLRPDHLGGRPFAVIAFASAPPRVYNEHDPGLCGGAGTARIHGDAQRGALPDRQEGEERAGGEQLRERLVAIVGHDLRDPLASISMAASILSSSALATTEEELVSRIQRSASRMARMISQILDFARIRSGQSFEPSSSPPICAVSAKVSSTSYVRSRPDKEIALSIEGRADARFDSTDRTGAVEPDWQRDPTRGRRTDQRDRA